MGTWLNLTFMKNPGSTLGLPLDYVSISAGTMRASRASYVGRVSRVYFEIQRKKRSGVLLEIPAENKKSSSVKCTLSRCTRHKNLERSRVAVHGEKKCRLDSSFPGISSRGYLPLATTNFSFIRLTRPRFGSSAFCVSV